MTQNPPSWIQTLNLRRQVLFLRRGFNRRFIFMGNALSLLLGPKSPQGPVETGPSVQSLLRSLEPMTPFDTVGRCLETFRTGRLSAIPIVSNRHVFGIVTEDALASWLFSLPTEHHADAALTPLGSILPLIVENPSDAIRLDASLNEADAYFFAHPGVSLLPVITDRGDYAGALIRTDLLAARVKTLAPARVGGMATPLGVYLTDGINAGGAGNLGLFLAGATLTSLFVAAFALTAGVTDWLTQREIFPATWLAAILHPVLAGYAWTVAKDIQASVPFVLMLIFIRLIPVAGYHAAEHQVVHCIERGQPLLPHVVAQMPRPHPRCGTNLAAAVTSFTAFVTLMTPLQGIQASILPAVILTVATWRQVGTFLQQYLTTRPASDKQLASGIKAATELMGQYRLRGEQTASFPVRIWRMGFVQLALGSTAVYGVISLLAYLFPSLSQYISGM